MLKLPEGTEACLSDLDGVLTQTAKVHAQAWKEMFDGFLREWSERTGEPFQEFDRPTDDDEHVDGLPRLDGVMSFLRSRGIDLPTGSPSDPPDFGWVVGVDRTGQAEALRRKGADVVVRDLAELLGA